jgi:prepilin-type N-terminal cleavage/methylation domain-containing protein
MCMHYRSRIARAGFTLAEMLMVIAIIAVLIALSAAAIMRFWDTGPYHATVANLGKVQAALDTQWQAVREKASRDNLNGLEGTLGVSDLADATAKPKYIGLRIAQAFPISFAEAFQPNALNAYGPYDKFLRSLLGIPAGDTAATASTKAQSCAPPHVQQAICLMMILERGPGNAGLTADKLEGGMVQRLDLKNAATPTPAAIQANGIVDGWGRAVLFTRNYQPPEGPQRPNQLVLVSTGVMRGKLKPWGRLGIVTTNPPTWPTPLGPEDEWEPTRTWNPTPSAHTLATKPGQTDEPVTTHKP